MLKNKLHIILFLLLSFIIANDNCVNCYNPIANAGDNEVYFKGCNQIYTEICLDGSESYDYESAPLSFTWSLNDVVSVENNSSIDSNLWPDLVLSNSQISNPCFIAPNETENLKYKFKLIVNDGQYSSDPDFVDIFIETENTPPAFSIDPETDFELKIGESFNLDLSSVYDLTGNGLTLNGYNVLDMNVSNIPGFEVQNIETYVYTLTATNSNSSTNSISISDGCDDIQIDVNVTIIGNERPYSITGPNQNIWSSDSFIIDAGLSFDPDGDSFVYEWLVPDELLDQMNDQSITDQTLAFDSQEGTESVYVFELNIQESVSGNFSIPHNGADIYISEYYEPTSSYPKYIELFNSEMQTLSMDNYEIWFIDGNSNWDGSSLASSLIPNKKLLFNSCMLDDGTPIDQINDVDLIKPADCCLQLASGYEAGQEYILTDGNLGICVRLDENNTVVPESIDEYSDITSSGDCLLNTLGQGKWLVPYFDDTLSGYDNQCKSMIFGDPDDTLIDYNISSSSWVPSCVDEQLSPNHISQTNIDSLNPLSALVLSYSSHEELENKNYTIWRDVQHGADDSYAIIKKYDSNDGGEIIDVIGDCNGNSELSWIQNPLQNGRLIRKEKVFTGNINWNKSFGESSEESEWYVYQDENELNNLVPAGEHYCGTCDNKITITSLNNNDPLPLLDTPHFIASRGNEFTVLGESSYDPDGYDIYFHWSADDGLGLGCFDGVSSSEEDCCLSNSINCENGNSNTEKSCCEEAFGVWNLDEDGITLGDLCDVDCCYLEQNPWLESHWDSESFCFDYVSYDKETCCINNGGEWFEIDASLNLYECNDSIGNWNGERCEVSGFANNPSECCHYSRKIDGENYDAGVWDGPVLLEEAIYRDGDYWLTPQMYIDSEPFDDVAGGWLVHEGLSPTQTTEPFNAQLTYFAANTPGEDPSPLYFVNWSEENIFGGSDEFYSTSTAETNEIRFDFTSQITNKWRTRFGVDYKTHKLNFYEIKKPWEGSSANRQRFAERWDDFGVDQTEWVESPCSQPDLGEGNGVWDGPGFYTNPCNDLLEYFPGEIYDDFNGDDKWNDYVEPEEFAIYFQNTYEVPWMVINVGARIDAVQYNTKIWADAEGNFSPYNPHFYFDCGSDVNITTGEVMCPNDSYILSSGFNTVGFDGSSVGVNVVIKDNEFYSGYEVDTITGEYVIADEDEYGNPLYDTTELAELINNIYCQGCSSTELQEMLQDSLIISQPHLDEMTGNDIWDEGEYTTGNISETTPDSKVIFKPSDWLYKVSPRLGISHVISDGATFTFNYGLYYQTPIYEFIYRNVSKLEDPGSAFEDAGNSGTSIGNATMTAGRTQSYELAFNMEITREWAFTAGIWVKDMDQLTTAAQYSSGVYEFKVAKNGDFGTAVGFDFTVENRGSIFNTTVQYTYSTAKASSEYDAAAFGAVQVDAPQQETLMPYDRTHDLTLSLYSTKLPFGINGGLTAFFQSGQPYTGVRWNSDKPEEDLLNKYGKRAPNLVTMDISVSKEIQLKDNRMMFGVNVYNLFDKPYTIDIYPITGNADKPGEYYEKRIARSISGSFYDRPWMYSSNREINFFVRIDFK